MFQALGEAFLDELKSIQNSTYKLFLVTLLPIFSFFLIVAIFYKGVVHELPLVVVDNDKSQLSRELIKHVDASATLSVDYKLNSPKEALALLQETKAYAVLIIPHNFQKKVLNHTQPKVTTMLNTQYILIGKIIKSALTQVVMYSSAEVELVQDLAKSGVFQKSINRVSPIGLQVSSYFNTYQNYFLFLVSALLPAIWQIFIVIVTLVSFGTMFKANEQRKFFKDEHLFIRIIGKLLPYTFIYTVLGALYLFFIYGTMAWEFQGSFSFTIFAMFVSVVAYQGVALLFFVTGFDYARSLSLGAVYTAPAFAFLGVTFPVYNMNAFALFWRDMLPVSHLMEIQISQANYGTNIFLELDKLLYIFAFLVVYIPIYFMFKRRLAL
jgi:ABC-2 type transport system permease protein